MRDVLLASPVDLLSVRDIIGRMTTYTIPESDQTPRALYLDSRTILRAEVGSTAHGVTHSSNDHDEIAVYIPPIIEVVGFNKPEHFVYRPGRQPHESSGAGDLDRVYYSLTKYTRLLNAGNPSILFVLFGPVMEIHGPGQELVDLRHMFINDRTRQAYLGYMRAQLGRIQGTRGAAGRMRRSPEGGGKIDWKYAMHMLRLGIQGQEYLSTGYISAPTLELDYLKEVRAGSIPLDEVIAKAEDNEKKIKQLSLPDYPRYTSSWWDHWLEKIHQEFWEQVAFPDFLQ